MLGTLERVLNAGRSQKALPIKKIDTFNGGLLPGIKANTSATDFAPLSQLQLMTLKSETWEGFGDIISADVGG